MLPGTFWIPTHAKYYFIFLAVLSDLCLSNEYEKGYSINIYFDKL